MAREIHPDLIAIALDKVNGDDFESFSKEFMSAVIGAEFVPLGGMHDGGANGYMDDISNVYATERSGIFYQFSVRKDYEQKIKQTVLRLKEAKKKVKRVIYVTSIEIPKIDNLEIDLSDEFDITISIRDKNYIVCHNNDSISTIAAYEHYLKSYTDFLRNVGCSQAINLSKSKTDPTIYIFLQQEVENRRGKSNLLKTITESLVLWALNDTDPAKDIFLTKNEALKKITNEIPWSKQFIKNEIDDALSILYQKGNKVERKIRKYKLKKKEYIYCLPHEERQRVELENSSDLSLRIDVIDELKNIILEMKDVEKYLRDTLTSDLAESVIRAIEIFFEREGLLFSHFITDTNNDDDYLNTITDRVNDVIDEKNISDQIMISLYGTVLIRCLSDMLYRGTPKQKKFLYKLSRTYVLLFILNADPKIVEYFQTMTSNFRLIVGTDMFVRMLTEKYLHDADQMTRNLIKMCKDGGAELILSEAVLDELYEHIKNADYHYTRDFHEHDEYMTKELARQCEIILIRAYYYAKFRKQVKSWAEYISNFITYRYLRSYNAKEELKGYLCSEFNLVYMDKNEMEDIVNKDHVNKLAEIISEYKERPEIAYRKALIVYSVYALRKKYKELRKVSEFGLSTWWLTQETHILKDTRDIIKKNASRYIMRPEFLLNFYALSPTKAEVVETYRNIFPTVMGIQIGNRIKTDTFNKIISKVNEYKKLDQGRAMALVSKLSDQIKTMGPKAYQGTGGSLDANLLVVLDDDD